MKYIGSCEYDDGHIQDNHLPFRILTQAERCTFAANLVDDQFVKSFSLKCSDNSSSQNFDGDIEAWIEYCQENLPAFEKAIYEIGQHSIQIEFSPAGEVLLIREKPDRNSYQLWLQRAEDKTIPRRKHR